MPFGLKNAPAVYQRAMENIFREEINEGWMVVYIDDICVFSRSAEEHCEHLRRTFERDLSQIAIPLVNRMNFETGRNLSLLFGGDKSKYKTISPHSHQNQI